MTKDNLKATLLEPVEGEERVLENFKSFMNWSWTSTWLQTSGYQKLQNLFQEAAESASQPQVMEIPPANEEFEGTYNDDTINLDMSLISLNVTDDEAFEDLDASMKSVHLSDSEESSESSSSLDEDHLVSSSDTSSESSDDSESDNEISCSDSELDTSLLPTRSFQVETNNASQDSAISTNGKETSTDNTDQSEITNHRENQEYLAEEETSHANFHDYDSEKLLTFGFLVYQPPMICRHPPPALGRDDSITKLREVLDEVLIKSGNNSSSALLDSRILFAPDQKKKNGSNLMKLREQDAKYGIFLPEIPLLHLRKSKITNLCTGYKEAGIVQLLMYMNDDEKERDWMKLVESTHIDHATRNIKILSLTIHLFLMVLFIRSLSADDATKFLLMLDTLEMDDAIKWAPTFEDFLNKSRKINATFSSHCDIMKHCDKVLVIAAVERFGGPDGYHLLLGAVKQLLPFAFLNGATLYGAFCVRFLITHYSTGPFYQGLKYCLFQHAIKKVTQT